MPNFNDYLKSVLDGVKDLAETTLKDFKKEAIKDGKAFLEELKEDLIRWTGLLASGAITRDDFDSLVRGNRDLAEMELLRQRGLAKAKADKFVNGLIELVIDKAFQTYL